MSNILELQTLSVDNAAAACTICVSLISSSVSEQQ
jgi:hypothetical protein